eukprot:14985011-Heterocapsa_arctica.AAC.1
MRLSKRYSLNHVLFAAWFSTCIKSCGRDDAQRIGCQHYRLKLIQYDHALLKTEYYADALMSILIAIVKSKTYAPSGAAYGQGVVRGHDLVNDV